MIYYGMTMKADVLGGDIYINFIFAAAVEVPALILVYLFIDRLSQLSFYFEGFETSLKFKNIYCTFFLVMLFLPLFSIEIVS